MSSSTYSILSALDDIFKKGSVVLMTAKQRKKEVEQEAAARTAERSRKRRSSSNAGWHGVRSTEQGYRMVIHNCLYRVKLPRESFLPKKVKNQTTHVEHPREELYRKTQ